MLTGDFSLCTDDDCAALNSKNPKACSSKSCQAALMADMIRKKFQGQPSMDQRLKALEEKLCSSSDFRRGSCKAFVYNDPSMCEDYLTLQRAGDLAKEYDAIPDDAVVTDYHFGYDSEIGTKLIEITYTADGKESTKKFMVK